MIQELNPLTYGLVTVEYLLSHRSLLERAQVALFRVKGKERGNYQGELASFDHLLPGEYALARQWIDAGTPPPPAAVVGDSFQTRWNELKEQTFDERVQALTRQRGLTIERLRNLPTPEGKAAAASDLTETVFLVNLACVGLQKGVSTEESKALAAETAAVLHSVIELIESAPLAVALFRNFQSHSTSQTLDHIVRVFALVTGFLLHYNKIHRAGLSARVRHVFPKHYRESYRRLMKKLPESRLTSDNLLRLPPLTAAQIRIHALGALLHDIGKVQDLDYFETGVDHEPEKIHQHPVVGAGLFHRIYGAEYEEARYIVGDHHNYLYHEEGYGLSRWERAKGHKPPLDIECCIGDTLETYASGKALGFLPVEVCSLVDVYDALTDPSRVYKTPLSAHNAILLMQGQFIRAGKVDPLLFDLFLDYLRSLGTEVPEDLGFQAKVETAN